MRAPRHPFAAAALLIGCVFGWRGEAELVGEHDLRGIATVRLDLPSTPMVIAACDIGAPAACPEQLRYAGRVLATGGSADDARAHAEDPALVFERDGALGWLQADIPLAVRGLVELELDAVELPSDRDLDVHTDRGDIDVSGTRAAVSITVGRGDVHVDGGDAGVAVLLEVGDIDVRTPGDADLQTAAGGVELVQTGAARDVVIHATGDVTVELASSSDVALDLRAGGRIHVTTDAVVALADRSLVRSVGAGTIHVEIRAGGELVVTERR